MLRVNRRIFLPLLPVLLVTAVAGPAAAQSAVADALVRRMTLEEKLTLLRGARDPQNLGQAGYWPGLPRLGIPALRLADGPAGIHVAREATAVPAPISLAATFDPAAAYQYGALLGSEARALQQDVLLAPHINLVRDPLFRRNHTTFGEDPLLSGRLAAAFIEGVQAQGVMAQAKHLAAYNGPDSVLIDEVTLREIYLPAFEAAANAGAASLMCAYNWVNGSPPCENTEIQNKILRQEWGFKGFITTDWGALHGPRALLAGVELEMPGREVLGRGGPYFARPLEDAIREGQIPISAVDQAVARILSQMDRFGLLNSKNINRPWPVPVEPHARIARRIAEQGAVLLKNDSGLLPLGAAELESLAVIGPTARQVVTGYLTERGSGFPQRFVSPLDALRRLARKARIHYEPGGDLVGVPMSPPELTSASHPARRMEFMGARALHPGERFLWRGEFQAQVGGLYVFMVQTELRPHAAGSGEILVDGRPVVRSRGFLGFGATDRPWSSLLPTPEGWDNARTAVHLDAGVHSLELRAESSGSVPLSLRFSWTTPHMRAAQREAAIRAAAAARAAVVFAWHEPGVTLALPEEQDELIRGVAAANPRTVVVLNAGAPVAMPWLDRVPAVLLVWYPGQEGGWATANLLLGRASPGGKLPVTFPARLEDTPARAPNHPERWAPPAAPGATGLDPNPPPVRFTEGLAIGYRWYDLQGIEPLFPFGHGLSYTSFDLSELRITPSREGFEVRLRIRNVGKRRGSEVVQIYLSPPEELKRTRPPRTLAAFAKVELGPRQSKRISLSLDHRALSRWSGEQRRWVLGTGIREVFAGFSSRDLRLRAQIRVTTPDAPSPHRD